jgi:hypothetical protein
MNEETGPSPNVAHTRKTLGRYIVVSVIVVSFVTIIGVAYLASTHNTAPTTGVCEYVEGSLNQYVCTYPNPNLTCGPEQYDPAHNLHYWNCHT